MAIRPTLLATLVIPAAAFVLYARIERRVQLENITLPDGFAIAPYATELPNAREMALGAGGTVFVGSMQAGNVYAIVDTDGDHVADRTHVIASGLSMPSGVAFRDGALYVAAIDRILRFDDIEARLDGPPRPVVVRDDLPDRAHHGWKFIAFGPDGMLYVPIGAPCNVCLEEDDRFGTIARMWPDGSGFEVYASGVRNSVGFDWDRRTGELWFTDNGRDMLGDGSPPDELNHATSSGQHFGFPYCHGGTIPDPEFATRSCSEFRPPAQQLGPHVAAIGMRFYDGDMFPTRYRNQIFIAEHGSWNRSPAAGHTGYRITVARVDGNRPASYETFAEGWLDGKQGWGRPADVLVLPDGSMLVSDDRAGAVYRITYRAP